MLGSRNLESCMLIQNNACASDPRQEPGAVAPLAGICAGGGPQGPFLPRTLIPFLPSAEIQTRLKEEAPHIMLCDATPNTMESTSSQAYST